MRFLLFFISLLHIHISRLPVFLTVLISCCIFGRPSKRTLMMLQVSHLLSVAKPEAALSHRVNIHSSSSLQSDESTFRRLTRIIASENSLSFPMNTALCWENIPPGKKSGKRCFGSVRKLCKFQFDSNEQKYIQLWFYDVELPHGTVIGFIPSV